MTKPKEINKKKVGQDEDGPVLSVSVPYSTLFFLTIVIVSSIISSSFLKHTNARLHGILQ
jgi:hypothetical protein